MSQELRFWLAIVEKEIAEPYLCEVGLILVCCINLLDSVKCFGFEMKSFPNFRKTTTAKLFASKIAVDETFILQNGFVVGPFEN